MNGILAEAQEKRADAYRRAVAHELSAEWHRKVGVRLGLVSTILTAIVGTSIFTIVIASLGLEGKGTLTVPQGIGPLIVFYGVIVLSILSPVLSACHAYLNEPDQVARHTSSSVSYYRFKDQLDGFLRKYEIANLIDEAQENAEKELDEITLEMAKEREKPGSISLTERAYKDADERIKQDAESSKRLK